MAYLNKVFLIGNLTRDPELRVTPKGTAICQFGIAVNRQFKDESGATRDETTFVDIEAWGKQGELVSKYLTKGSLAMVEGRLKLDQWEDKQSGQKRQKLGVVCERVLFLGGDGGEQRQPAARSAAPQNEGAEMPPRTAQPPEAQSDFTDDVPF